MVQNVHAYSWSFFPQFKITQIQLPVGRLIKELYTYEFIGIIKKKPWVKILKFVGEMVICYWLNTVLTSKRATCIHLLKESLKRNAGQKYWSLSEEQLYAIGLIQF